MSTDINLPKALEPKFPDRCVSCGQASPGGYVRVSTNAIGWWTVVLWLPGRRLTVDIPACEKCRRQMFRQRWLRGAICGIFIVIGVGIAYHLLGSRRGPLGRWMAMGITLICLLPWLAWEVFFPRPFDMTAYPETVDYEFRDAAYARDFAALNLPRGFKKFRDE